MTGVLFPRVWQNLPFPKRGTPVTTLSEKIEIFFRHCAISTISQHKKRFPDFTREKCCENLLATIHPAQANLTFFYDAKRGPLSEHFLSRYLGKHPMVQVEEGSEAGSFLRLLDHVEKLQLPPQTILYFVEDDYLHRPGWIEVLQEGFQIPGVEYVTLYDHSDKYSPLYGGLEASLFVTPSTHWRSTPSTTQTFAVRYETLLRDLSIHRKFSKGCQISRDHEKFCCLQQRGALLVSPIPGWSTHMEPDHASPTIRWEEYLAKFHSSIHAEYDV